MRKALAYSGNRRSPRDVPREGRSRGPGKLIALSGWRAGSNRRSRLFAFTSPNSGPGRNCLRKGFAIENFNVNQRKCLLPGFNRKTTWIFYTAASNFPVTLRAKNEVIFPPWYTVESQRIFAGRSDIKLNAFQTIYCFKQINEESFSRDK